MTNNTAPKNNTERACTIKNQCSFKNVEPAILPIPYPSIEVQCQNKYYADLLTLDYCGMVSELTAITQYVNNEIKLSKWKCEEAQTILSIAQAEMIHLQKLGETIILLGGFVEFNSCSNNKCLPWSPNYIDYGTNPRTMLLADLKAEKDAISQYQDHIKKIDDPYIKDLLWRIIQDEEYHIILFESILRNYPSDFK